MRSVQVVDAVEQIESVDNENRSKLRFGGHSGCRFPNRMSILRSVRSDGSLSIGC